jgi:hypothetical protein
MLEAVKAGFFMRRRQAVAIVSVFLLVSLSVWLVLTYVLLPASTVELQVMTTQETGIVNHLVGVNSYGPDVTGLYQDSGAYDFLQSLGLQRLRVWCRFGWQLAASSGWGWHHTIFNGSTFADAQNPNFYNWTYLDLLVEVVNNTGAAPILTFLGCPRSLTTDWAPNSPPDNFTVYAEVVAHVVMHYEQGWPGTGQIFDFDYIEIGNEPNLSSFWNGTKQDFLNLYTVVAHRLSQIGGSFKIGGPGLADINLTDWTTSFLGHVTGIGVPLDFFSWHAYWDDPTRVVGVIEAGTNLLMDQGFGQIERIFDEYGLGLLSDSQWGTMTAALHLTEVLIGAAHHGIDIACFGFVKDVPIHPNITTMFGDEANFGLLTRNPTTPKPTYHALKAFAAITEQPIVNASIIETPALFTLPMPLTALVTKGSGLQNYTILIANKGWRTFTTHINLQGTSGGTYQITTRELSSATIQQYDDWSPPSDTSSTTITIVCPPQSVLWITIHSAGSILSPLHFSTIQIQVIPNVGTSHTPYTIQLSLQDQIEHQGRLIGSQWL